MSGKYTQGRGYLYGSVSKNRGTHCCLGVLGKICGASNTELDGKGSSKLVDDGVFLKKSFWNKIGFGRMGLRQKRLSYMNDTKNLNFNGIAFYIKKQVNKYAKQNGISYY